MHSLVKNNLLQHKDKDVRLLVAVCCTEALRVLAPEPGFSDEVFKVMSTPITCCHQLFFSLSYTYIHAYAYEIVLILNTP